MEEKTINKKDFRNLAPIISFLSYEVFAFIAFSLTNSFLLFAILSLVLVILLAIVTKRDIDKEGYSNYLFFAMPITIFGVLSALSYFNTSEFVNSSSLSIRIFMPICFASLGLIGCFVSKARGFKIKHALIAIYGALALYCLINLLVTMVQFLPFYTIKYSDYFIYYNGKPSPAPIGETAYALIGFEMVEVSVNYFSYFPSILLTSVIALFFIKPKENKKLFLAYLAFSLIAFLSLLFTPTIMTFITSFLVVIAILIIVLKGKSVISNKFIKNLMITILIIFILGFLAILLNAQSNFAFIHKITTSNKLFDKLFNVNHIVDSYNAVLDGLFSSNKLFGFPPYYSDLRYENIWPSGGWISDMFMTSGLFGFGFFVFFLYLGIKNLINYYNDDNGDDIKDKSLIIALVVVILGYSLINYDARPFIYSSMVDNYLLRGPFILVFFLMGYIYAKGLKQPIKEDEKKEEVNNYETKIEI